MAASGHDEIFHATTEHGARRDLPLAGFAHGLRGDDGIAPANRRFFREARREPPGFVLFGNLNRESSAPPRGRPATSWAVAGPANEGFGAPPAMAHPEGRLQALRGFDGEAAGPPGPAAIVSGI